MRTNLNKAWVIGTLTALAMAPNSDARRKPKVVKSFPSVCDGALCLTGLRWDTDSGRGNWIRGMAENRGDEWTISSIMLNFTIRDSESGTILGGALYVSNTPLSPGDKLSFEAVPQRWRDFHSFADSVTVTVWVGSQRETRTLHFDPIARRRGWGMSN